MRAITLLLLLPLAACGQRDTRPTFVLSPSEQALGWEVLFDGTSTESWRGYRKDAFPEKGWKIEDGWLRVVAGAGGGDIITRRTYGDFELELEWRASERGNSGIMFRVTEDHGSPWMSGPEYQILDDGGHELAPSHQHSAGALYDLVKPDPAKVVYRGRRANHTRIRLKSGWLQHWLNGLLVLETPVEGEAWKALIAASKFSGYEGFGIAPRGHVALQDHGNDIWFRSIKIRALDGTTEGTVDLLADGMKGLRVFPGSSKAFSLREDGVLSCSGNPTGYVRTEAAHADLHFSYEWRWAAEAGNSGLLLRCTGEDVVWPTCIESQLMAGMAGDFIVLGPEPPALRTLPQRMSGRRSPHYFQAERPVGTWNHGEALVLGDRIEVWINGHLVNQGHGADPVAGFLALQSEGAPIEFRKLHLRPLD